MVSDVDVVAEGDMDGETDTVEEPVEVCEGDGPVADVVVLTE